MVKQLRSNRRSRHIISTNSTDNANTMCNAAHNTQLVTVLTSYDRHRDKQIGLQTNTHRGIQRDRHKDRQRNR